MNEHGMDLSPARWIWLPSQRTLANTFVLFRRDIRVVSGVKRACGWMTADSRYRLTVNGARVQWGPAPSDPRWPDADPIDVTAYLNEGVNTLGIEVLYYGHGDGTWVAGKPGLLFTLLVEEVDGTATRIVSDSGWDCLLDRAHPPGQYKRWYLRALQEDFDARKHPSGWDTPGFARTEEWLPAMEIQGSASLPSIATHYDDYMFNSGITGEEDIFIRRRQIPLIRETAVEPVRLAETGLVKWHRDPNDWFENRIPDSFRYIPSSEVVRNTEIGLEAAVPATHAEKHESGAALTFEFAEQVVGFPFFRITASEGTIIEILHQESHVPGQSQWLDTHHFSWTRYTCREGLNTFVAFEYESLKWMQLHIRGASVPVQLHSVGVLRRLYDWPEEPHIDTEDKELQTLMNACLNTIRNNSLDTMVDGNGRERQQYSGDLGHQLYSLRTVFGDTLLPARFLRTYSEGLTTDGYFMDCWPAYDRMVRISQRQLGLTRWGPIIDHGIQFVFDNWNHYMETGNMEAVREPYPRLLKFADWLGGLLGQDGLLPVEGLGVPTVWIDHAGYREQRHKQCAFNLYAAAMYQHALAPLMRLFGDEGEAEKYERLGRDIQHAVQRRFWDDTRKVFVNNLPWMTDESGGYTCDRSLATAVLFRQCPDHSTAAAVEILAGKPAHMGLSYPPNAVWRYKALMAAGRVDVILNEFRTIWARMSSVTANNTMSEDWNPRPDSGDQWSHASTGPLQILFSEIAGIKPVRPGYEQCAIEPQLGDLPSLRLTAHTVRGPIRFEAIRDDSGAHLVRVIAPESIDIQGKDITRLTP